MKLEEARRDYYRRLAREEGYKSRAAFKLLEAVEKYGLIARGDRVADFGAAPGGWLQVACESAGERGRVVGLDTSPIELALENLRVLKMDVYDASAAESVLKLLGAKADVVLSDLSPKISGVWDLDQGRQAELTLRVVALMDQVLRSGGRAMLKVFEGERFQEVRRALKERFERVTIMKPRASRRESSEMYLVCTGHVP